MQKIIFSILTVIFSIGLVSAQETKIEGKTFEEQFESIKDLSQRWQTYTMIPDPWFKALHKTTLDTLNSRTKKINDLQQLISNKDKELSNLNEQLSQVNEELIQTQKEKDSFSILGMSLGKSFFLNLITFIFITLIVSAVITVLYAKREHSAARKERISMEELKQEFENYRQESRIAKEKLVVQHHREILKLKGK